MRIRHHRRPLAAATTLFLMALATPVAAQSVWTGAVDDDWFTAGNWQDGVVPPNDTNPVHINTSAQAPVIEGNPAVVSEIVIGNDAGSNASLVVRGGGTLEAQSIQIASTGSTGTVTIAGDGSALNTATLHVGVGDNGTLNIRDGGDVDAIEASIGRSAGTSVGESATSAVGLVTVDGFGSTFDVVDLDVGVDGDGTLDVRDSAFVLSESAAIGVLTGSTGLVTVGTDSTWSNEFSIVIGDAGSGTLNIHSGGIVQSGDDNIIGNTAGSVGLVTVDGDDSTWSTTNVLRIGNGGDGTLSITGDGTVESEISVIAKEVGSTGLVTVDGPGSTWLNASSITVGFQGNGTLSIRNQSRVETGSADIGHADTSTSLVTVGDGSFFSISDLLLVGNGGNGTLNIVHGGFVKSLRGLIADGTGSLGLVTVDGASSAWANSGDLIVANGGNGTLNILDSGNVESQDGIIAFKTGSIGQVTVDGNNSIWKNTNGLSIGGSGNGALSIFNGGKVESGTSSIGDGIGSTGRVTVQGAGSNWLNATDLLVGNAGNGTLIVADDGAVTSTNDSVFVGMSGAGTLNIASGGAVVSVAGSIAEGPGATGVVTVDGVDSRWLNAGDLVIGKGGNGTLSVSGGGTLSSGRGIVGDFSESHGAITVAGAGSTWTNADNLFVGSFGVGALTIADGGEVSNGSGFIGNFGDSDGTVTVTGAGSIWSNERGIFVGAQGTGTLTVADGGSVESLEGSIGHFDGSTGSVAVDGAGSTWAMENDLNIGFEGNGTLDITNGGVVESSNGFIGNSSVFNVSVSTGSVTVDGAGSTWTIANDLNVGSEGHGTLNIFNGGVVAAGLASISGTVGSTSALTVDGPGAIFRSGVLDVGTGGKATLNIFNGGLVENTQGMGIGSVAGSTADVTVDGASSRLIAEGDDALSVGLSGIGTLDIRNGGLVRSGAAGRSSFVGDFIGSIGTANVDGIGSAWINNDGLVIGREGSGALSISNGGVVTGSIVHLAEDVGSEGALSIGAGVGQAAVAAGTLDAPSVVFGAGIGTLNFNHTGHVDGSDVVFDAVISGAGTVNHTGPGMTVLTAANTHSGNTNVSGGELRVDGSLLPGTTAIVDGSGALSGSGSVGEVFVRSGGTLQGVQGRTLTIEDLHLADDATVSVALGTAGGAGLFHVNNTFELDGTLQVTDLGGFGAGVYRLFDYDGTLLDNGLEIGTSPAGVPASDLQVQTSVDKQINLVSLGGQALNFWDGGDAALHDNNAVDGGSGTWDIANTNWTVANGAVNGVQRPQPGFAIFQGTAGTVTVDDTAGAVEATGLQFASHGYRLAGDALALTQAQSVIRVGDGSAASSGYTATIANALTGTGGVVKTDLGTLVLSGQNSYAGGTHIQDGVLQLGEGGTTGSITGNVVNDGVLAFNRSNEIVFAGAISGSGHVRQQGSGTTILTGANTHTGGTTIASGRLQVGNGGTTGTLTGNVANAGTLAFNRSDSNTFTGTISGSGAVHQAGTGTTTFTGNHTYTGGTAIQAGTLQIGNGGTTGALTGNVANAGTLVFNRSDRSVFAGAISGNGAVQQRGAGTLALTGNHTYTGATTVATGVLAVDGSIASSALTTVASGARLQGVGTVGNTTVQGTIAPGNSIGTLTVDGDYTQATAAAYTAELGAGTASDQLHVTGAANLQAGALLVAQRLAGTTATAGTRYTLLTADGGLSGRYTLISDKFSAFLGARLVYDATHAFLDLTRVGNFASVARTRNQIAAANGVESLGSGRAVFDAVLNLADEAQARAAFDQLSGEIHASTASALLEESHVVRDAAGARLRNVAHEDTAPASWGQLYGAWGRSDSDGNAGERDVGRGGFLLGHDIGLGTARFGVIGGTGRISVRVDDRRSKADSDSWHLGVYGGLPYGAWQVRGGVAYSGHDVETQRQVRFTGIDQSLRANYDMSATQAFAEASYSLEVGSLRYEPFASVALINTRSDRFAERGGSAALHVEEAATDSTFATLGVRAENAFKSGDRPIRLHGALGWRHGFGDEIPTADLSFAGGDAFIIAGSPISRDAAVLEAGIDMQLGPLATLGVSYSGQLAEDAQEHSAQAQLQVKF